MKITIVASEAMPHAKTGGLADVVGAMPRVLRELGHETLLIMPYYRQARREKRRLENAGMVHVPVGRELVPCNILRTDDAQTGRTLFLEQDRYFDRPELYGGAAGDYHDNCARFTFLSRGAMEAMRTIGFRPDIIHAHDWQTALVPAYLRLLYASDPFLGKSACLFTIHNLAYQGVFWHWDMNVIGLDWSHFNMKEFEYWGKINFMKGGIVYADVINTVSPTYAAEIMTPAFGQGLHGVLSERDGAVHGVVNGIDESVWNPATDRALPACYSATDIANKAACKRALQISSGLPHSKRAPLIGMVSRLAEQKGLDVVARALPGLFDRTRIQVVLLGNGEDHLKLLFQSIAKQFPDRISLAARLDEDYAHQVFAGADMMLAPSRFEPCGLTQLYGLRYGAVPIVRRTGGLADTVVDCTPLTLEERRATGFVFDDAEPEALSLCVERAIAFYDQPALWSRLIEIGMRQDWSWTAGGRRYVELYKEAIDRKGV